MLEFALTVYTPILIKCSLNVFFQIGFGGFPLHS